jgi:hypothetical protein
MLLWPDVLFQEGHTTLAGFFAGDTLLQGGEDPRHLAANEGGAKMGELLFRGKVSATRKGIWQ